MKNILSYIKDKIYYIAGATIVILILLIVISSCSFKSGSYEDIEDEMVDAAKSYFETRTNKLPKKEDSVIKVTVSTLIDAELLDEIVDPTDEEITCNGYVEVTKIGKEYSYTPFLTCKGKYEPKHITDKIQSLKLDELGQGVYNIDGEYIYRGKDVKNYVKFAEKLWRIVKIDENGVSSLILAEPIMIDDAWDSRYNSQKDDEVGITTSYLDTDIRKKLKTYYNKKFTTDEKARMTSTNLCVGKYYVNEDDYETIGEVISKEKDCSITKENEKIGLLTLHDYKNASLDEKCTNVFSKECLNYNYLSDSDSIDTWTLNSTSNNTYDVFYINETVDYAHASLIKKINPVIYLTNKIIVVSGKGTKSNPYIVR